MPAGRTSGFTLVEIALALVVISVGVMAILALFPEGLTLSRETVEETRCAMFAEDVFNSYRSIARMPMFATNWDGFLDESNPDLVMSVPATSAWAAAQWPTNSLRPGDAVTPVILRAAGSAIEEMPLQYRLRIANNATHDGPDIAVLRLEVWPGLFTTNQPPYRFYTEIYNHGRRP
jgi:prepilin-type N-terminal cleavage/methylation domain-containing protein